MDIQTVTRFFMWCTILNGAMLVLSSIMLIMSVQDFIYRVHSKWFSMPRETFNAIIYSYLGLFKIIFIVFNLVPYVALLIIG